MAKKKRTRGRPAGSRNQTRPCADVFPGRCPRCGSTRRTPYRSKPVIRALSGVADGKPYTHVVWRATRCLDCGQARTDRTYLYQPDVETLDRLERGEEEK